MSGRVETVHRPQRMTTPAFVPGARAATQGFTPSQLEMNNRWFMEARPVQKNQCALHRLKHTYTCLALPVVLF